MSDGLCWCATDTRCPHGISHRLSPMWEDLETVIDEVLKQFDRKSIRRYLKKGIDGNSKSSDLKEIYRTPDDMKQVIDKSNKLKDSRAIRSPDLTTKKRRMGGDSDIEFSKTHLQPLNRAVTASETETSGEYGTMPTTNLKSSKSLPRLSTAKDNNNNNNPRFSRELMATTLPKVPPRTNGTRKEAWGSNNNQEGNKFSLDDLQPNDNHYNTNNTANNDEDILLRTNPFNPLQAETIIASGLIRIVDQLAKKVLPWQAVLCPRAVESLQDLRLNMIQSKHTQFMQQMKSKLEEKVNHFMNTKEEEVERWLQSEVMAWQDFLQQDETDLTDFIATDLARITKRSMEQEYAYKQRELLVANDLDDLERDQTREQLINFRKIVRASKQAIPSNQTLSDQSPKIVEVRVLQDSIAKAKSSTQKKVISQSRVLVKKQEEGYDWLCSLADNALTAAISEGKVKGLYSKLDQEKGKSMDSLTNAMAMYKEQHNQILDAITVFTGRIHQHATDYLQREQLVNRAFLQYLTGVVSGEIKSHTNEQKKTSYAWETKSLIDRQIKKEQSLVQDFLQHVNPLDKMVSEFKDKLRIQMDHVTMKLQSIVNGKENDINARKSVIHKKLAKHVNKACNNRRQRLKHATTTRKDEFELETITMHRINELTSDLRTGIDSLWVKEHLKERSIYEASIGRLERLEKSSLIIWNKHTNMSKSQYNIQSDYQDWLDSYKQDRNLKIIDFQQLILENQSLLFLKTMKEKVKQLAKQINKSFCYIMDHIVLYNENEVEESSLDQDIETIKYILHYENNLVLTLFQEIRNYLESFVSSQVLAIAQFQQRLQQELYSEYQLFLNRLDHQINSQIHHLKDMEQDLYETIRLTILQHEVENNVFEQLSCARMEKFWIDWQKKVTETNKELLFQHEDYEISKRYAKKSTKGGGGGLSTNKTDRQIDDLMTMAKESTMIGNQNKMNNTGGATAGAASSGVAVSERVPADNNQDEKKAGNNGSNNLSDNERILLLLDGIRMEIYREFIYKTTRDIERIKRELGEGRKQYVPLYSIAKVLAIQCDAFYEKAKLNERCIGRVSLQGVLLFQEGLPLHSKYYFIVGCVMAFISILPIMEPPIVEENKNRTNNIPDDPNATNGITASSVDDQYYYKVDCTDVIMGLENCKVYFTIGLLMILFQFHEYGEYMIKSECLWFCSKLEINPPLDLLQNHLAKGLKEYLPKEFVPSGIFSEDPVDLINHLLALPTDNASILQMNKLKVKAATAASSDDNNQILDKDYRTLIPTLIRLQREKIPLKDCVLLASFLGQPDGTIEFTTHRMLQVISLWRRVSLAMMKLVISPPSTEFPRIQEIITTHHNQYTGRKRYQHTNIQCLSPFDNIAIGSQYLTSIHGLPISYLQSLCMLSHSGNCDIWLEDPKQSFRYERIVSELQDMIELYLYSLPKSMIYSDYLQLSLPKNIIEIMKQFDMNYSSIYPLECIRTYLQRDDLALTNNQISLIYWSFCQMITTNYTGTNAVTTTDVVLANPSPSSSYTPLIQTNFQDDPEDYMLRFAQDVDHYLNSMPSIDSTVLFGYVMQSLSPTAAYELVSDAMKLDISARNPMPATCAVWMGQYPMPLTDIFKRLLLPSPLSNDGNFLLNITNHAIAQLSSQSKFQGIVKPASASASTLPPVPAHVFQFNTMIHTAIEVDLLIKYSEILEIKYADRFYGPVNNTPITVASGAVQDDTSNYWKELLSRRLQRLTRMTLSWRDIMLNEWSESLYISRKLRYQQRIVLIQKSISVYHSQYAGMRDTIVQERSSMMHIYSLLQQEIVTLVQDQYAQHSANAAYYDRMLRRYEGEYERFYYLLEDMIVQYIRHISSIKRYGIDKINLASEKLQKALFVSCSGLITGYTVGYAQEYFNQLISRGEIWRKTLTTLHGQVILQKEQYMMMKDELDRDLTVQITNRLTINRQDTRPHLSILNEHSTVMLDTIATTRNNYAKLQKDTNVRLILRIEKAIREVRKLRNIGELHPELETEVLRDIRGVLTNAKEACVKIVKQIENHSYQQLQSLIPLRQEHREKLQTYVTKVNTTWHELELVLFPFVDEYEQEIKKQLYMMKSKAIDEINAYRDVEIKSIFEEYTIQRVLLIASFRKHFREYDLSELSIFERFNQDVYQTLQDMLKLWGPSKPKFLHLPIKELSQIANNSLLFSTQDILQSSSLMARPNNEYTYGSEPQQQLVPSNGGGGISFTVQDDTILSRMELSDIFSFHLTKSYELVVPITSQFLKEKQSQLEYVDEMSMQKNGDMIRPQVKAVLDLLISGIEIDHDFYVGYENLIQATNVKANDSLAELGDFVEKYLRPEFPISIPQTIELTNQKIALRQQEVNALLDASNQHLIADHTKLDVLYSSGEKDVEEWTNLTMQLVENTFHTAELNYLSNLWPSPESTPRLYSQEVDESIGITGLSEEDRIKKLQALIAETQTLPLPTTATGTVGKALTNALVPVNTPNNMLQYRGDVNELMQNLQLSAEEEIAIEMHKEEKRQAKELRKQQKQQEFEQMRKLQDEKEKLLILPKEAKTGLPSLHTKELQQGWFECIAPEGYMYYFNPQTNESLWDLPQFLKQPLLKAIEGDGGSMGSLQQDDLLDSPRNNLLLLEGSNDANQFYLDETMPIRVVDKDYRLEVTLDPKVIMSEVTEEARAIAALVVSTAVDITDIIRGRQGKDESVIATLLGDRYEPALLQQRKAKFHEVEDDDSDAEDQLRLHHYLGEEEKQQKEQQEAAQSLQSHASVRDILALTKDNHGDIGAQDGPNDEQLAKMLMELGLGSALENSVVLFDNQEQSLVQSIIQKEQMKQTVSDIVQPNEWLALGLGVGDGTKGDNETEDSSDGEDYTGFKTQQKNKTIEEMKYLEARENDLMHGEDLYSIAIENEIENSNCQSFLSQLVMIVNDNTAYEEDKESLLRLSQLIKPSNCKTIMKELKLSWQKLDEMIVNTKLMEDMKAKELDSLRTKEGMLRQQYILEHAEDIQDMTNFLHQEACLSKVLARQMSTELIVKKIATPKKLAKIWSRNEITLTKEFPQLDQDDVEEVENALKKLLGHGSSSSAAFSMSSLMIEDEPLPALVPSIVEELPQDQLQLQEGSSNHNSNNNNFNLDPSWITEVEVEEDHEEEREAQQQAALAAAPDNTASSYTLTKEGYKSFHGGWIEGVNEANETYYYNMRTGQSAWNLPSLLESEGSVNQIDNVNTNANDSQQLVPFTQDQYQDPYYDAYTTTNNDDNYSAAQQIEYYQDGEYYANASNNNDNYNSNSNSNSNEQWNLSDALGFDHIDDYNPNKPRALPSYATPEVQVYSKQEGTHRQMILLQTQDRWQNALVKVQHGLAEQQTNFMNKRQEMYEKVTKRVENRLNVFVEDIKFMQKILKKELGEANATERDLRRLFEEDASQTDSQGVLKAEKLSFILESLETFKLTISEKYESAFKQIDKFTTDWELIKTELYQVGDIYDEGVAANLEQGKLACEHQAKVFVYDQLKFITHIQKQELHSLRASVHRELKNDTLEHQHSREQLRATQFEYFFDRATRKETLYREYQVVDRMLEEELTNQGYPPIAREEDVLTEEELVMSYLITQIEMEHSLASDYTSIVDATRLMANELQQKIDEFDEMEKVATKEDGSLFNKHRETLERHEQALHITLNKVRNRMNEGYQILQSRIEALDYEVERAAEEELYQGSIDQQSSVISSSNSKR